MNYKTLGLLGMISLVYMVAIPYIGEQVRINLDDNHAVLQSKGNATCSVCKAVVGLIDHELELGNKTIQDIASLADDLCHDLAPPPITDECDFFIDHIQEIVAWLTDHMSVKDVCIKLGFCSAF